MKALRILLLASLALAKDDHELLTDFLTINPFENLVGVSQTCQDDYNLFLQKISLGESSKRENLWALKMRDAYGKFPNAGELWGNGYHMGSYSSCLEIEGPENSSGFKGMYCPISSKVINTTAQEGTRSLDPELQGTFTPLLPPMGSALKSPVFQLYLSTTLNRFSICIPNSCTKDEVNLALRNLSLSNQAGDILVAMTASTCLSKDTSHSIDASDIVMICILSLFLGICFLGTAVDIARRLGVWQKKQQNFLELFSLSRNFERLVSTETPKGHITCLDGIRFFSMSWVLVAHVFTFIFLMPVQNLLSILNTLSSDPLLRIILNGYVSVDSFFFLSGLLLAFLTLKELDKTKGRLNIAMYYLHRYLRLTVVYGIVIGFHATLYRFFAFGPGTGNDIEVNNCRKNWWKNLLYINNNFKETEYCLGQSWYVATEMQMFLVSPLVIWPLWYIHKNKGVKLAIAYVSTWIATFTLVLLILCIVEKWPASSMTENSQSYFIWNYVTPWCRCQPYLVGMLVGYMLHITKNDGIKLSPFVVTGLWIGAFATGLSICYALNAGDAFIGNIKLSDAEDVLYGSLHRLCWGLCLGWVVFACFHGYGGWIDSFLSWKGFAPLSRLTFAMYLVHISVISTAAAQVEFNIETSTLMIAVLSCSFTVISALISVLIVILLEMPTLFAEKKLFIWIAQMTNKSKSS